MFTGIIEEVGKVGSMRRTLETATMTVLANLTLDGLQLGDSIAVNGVCLTVRQRTQNDFQVDLSEETLRRSNLGEIETGNEVNLERPLTPGSRLGGHFVQGHVDGIGQLLSKEMKDGFGVWAFSLPFSLRSYIVEKGSIAVNGVSLTVAKQTESGFEVALIPHTLENTNLHSLTRGQNVNLEVDILAKYVESFLKNRADAKSSRLTEEYLKEQGY
ncbi:MAG: riboflavin synthase [Terriglobia bacterium]